MGITCQLVRLDTAELAAMRADPLGVLAFVDRAQPTDRWVDLDQAWLGLLAAFEAQPRADFLVKALLPGAAAFDESAAGGHTVTFAEPDLVRTVAGALTGLDGAALEASHLATDMDALRRFYRQAAAERQAVAVVIG